MDQPLQPRDPGRLSLTGYLLPRVGQHVAGLSWETLSPAVRDRAPLVLLDVLGCGLVGDRLGVHADFVEGLVSVGGPAEATLWGRGGSIPAAHAALANGTVAHHVEMDDGNPRASLHGGVTIIPAALAVAEATGSSGRAALEAIVAGYDAAIACGRLLLPGIGAHRLHPPSMVGCFGAAAAASRLLGLDADGIADAIALAATLIPMGPFETFTRGAPVKDLYGGWPAYLGVQAAYFAQAGLSGPLDVLEAPLDGLGTFFGHGPLDTSTFEPDPDELLYGQFKAYSTCRSVQPTLTAVERLPGLPIDPDTVESIDVETYPYAVGLDEDADPSSPIGARTSLGYGVASMLLDGEVYPDAFVPAAVNDPRRQSLASKVRARVAPDMAQPVVRGARVVVRLADGTQRRSEVRASRWSSEDPATPEGLREKFRRLAGVAAPAVEAAVDDLAEVSDLGRLVAALGRQS